MIDNIIKFAFDYINIVDKNIETRRLRIKKIVESILRTLAIYMKNIYIDSIEIIKIVKIYKKRKTRYVENDETNDNENFVISNFEFYIEKKKIFARVYAKYVIIYFCEL